MHTMSQHVSSLQYGWRCSSKHEPFVGFSHEAQVSAAILAQVYVPLIGAAQRITHADQFATARILAADVFAWLVTIACVWQSTRGAGTEEREKQADVAAIHFAIIVEISASQEVPPGEHYAQVAAIDSAIVVEIAGALPRARQAADFLCLVGAFLIPFDLAAVWVKKTDCVAAFAVIAEGGWMSGVACPLRRGCRRIGISLPPDLRTVGPIGRRSSMGLRSRPSYSTEVDHSPGCHWQ